MAIIHRIGAPENDSEARAIKRFGKDLPTDYFVFHNFELTTGRDLPYEYDIVVLTPHALYSEIGQIEMIARGLEVDPAAPADVPALRAHLEGRLTALKCKVLKDFAEARLRGLWRASSR
jgi:hypothetical protein